MSLDGPDSYFEGDWGADEETNANAHVSDTDEPEQEAAPANEAEMEIPNKTLRKADGTKFIGKPQQPSQFFLQ